MLPTLLAAAAAPATRRLPRQLDSQPATPAAMRSGSPAASAACQATYNTYNAYNAYNALAGYDRIFCNGINRLTD